MSGASTALDRRARVAVVIPYYQRASGVLAGCVKSILAQEGPFDLQVVIVDDGSPLSAEEDLRLAACMDPRVQIVRQSNAGAGAARNKALDSVGADAEYIALLDSDDQWADGFLAVAVHALNEGCDLFFSDSRRFSQQATRFQWEDDPALNLRAEDHLPIDSDQALYQYLGDFFDYAVRRSSIMSSSAMVYRRRIAPDLRFSEQLRNGQDRLFKLHLSRRVERVAFSPRVLCIEGEGVNIFDSASWGSPKALVLSSSYIDLAKAVRAELPLNERQRQYVDGQLISARKDFVANLVHLLKRRTHFDWGLVLRTLRRDPAAILALRALTGSHGSGRR